LASSKCASHDNVTLRYSRETPWGGRKGYIWDIFHYFPCYPNPSVQPPIWLLSLNCGEGIRFGVIGETVNNVHGKKINIVYDDHDIRFGNFLEYDNFKIFKLFKNSNFTVMSILFMDFRSKGFKHRN